MTDIRSKKCVFVSHCMLAQVVRAEGIVKHSPGPVKPVIQFCLDNDINIFQMPCPETLCANGGLGRDPHGKKWYEQHGLRETSSKIADGQVTYMRTILDGGYEILAILGIEFSPACSVNYLNRGPVIYKAEGIYIEELKKCMALHKIDIPFIGVNQRAHLKLARELSNMIKGADQKQRNLF